MALPDDSPDSLARDLRDDLDRAAGRSDDEFRSRLVRLAGKVLDPRTRGATDPEDIVQSVFGSFFRQQAEEPMAVQSRLELWRLPATIARRKCVKAARRALAGKRGGGQIVAAVSGASELDGHYWSCNKRHNARERAWSG
jgi:hypothetical protein